MKIFKTVLIAVLISIIVVCLLLLVRYERREERRTAIDSTSVQNSVTGVTMPGTYTKTMESDGRTRSYQLHIPTNYDANEAVPLVILMHGGGGDGARIMSQTRFDQKSDVEGFILVAPDGVENNWNDGRGHTARGATTDTVTQVDDVQFLTDLVEELKATYNLDETRLYITGVSNGAMMSQRMICDAPGIFAAVGAASGPMRTQTADTCKGMAAVIGIQGTDDPFWPMSDENGIPEFPRVLERNADQEVVTIEKVSDIWVTKNSCDETPVTEKLTPTVDDGTSVTHYVYNNCAPGLEVEYYVVTGMGHGWPPYQGTRLAGPASGNLNATDVIWDFLAAQSKQ